MPLQDNLRETWTAVCDYCDTELKPVMDRDQAAEAIAGAGWRQVKTRVRVYLACPKCLGPIRRAKAMIVLNPYAEGEQAEVMAIPK